MTLPPLLPRAARPFDVVGYGENSVDFVSTVSAWPAPDTKQRVVSFERHPGGQVATAIAACARLGCRARYAGVFGDDVDGQWVRQHLESIGVSVAGATVTGVASRTAAIVVNAADGARAVLEHRDSRLSSGFARLAPDVFASARVLMIDATDPDGAVRAADVARASATPVVLDVDAASEGLAPLLARTDILITSATVPQELTGAATVEEGLRKLAGLTPATIVVATLGADGSVALFGDRIIRTPGVTVEAVDTTGAGDVFRAGFVAGWLRRDAPPDLEVLLRQANAAAGLSCRGPGAQGALPVWHEIDALV